MHPYHFLPGRVLTPVIARAFLLLALGDSLAPAQPAPVLTPVPLGVAVRRFNVDDRELYPQFITNGAAFEFLARNIPLLECPDPDLQETYYFRWWTFRKHIKQTPDGFVISEFLPPVPWAGKHNTISCAAGHHLYEGRWLANPVFLDDYSTFWFRKGGSPRTYSFWAADAIYARHLAQPNPSLLRDLLPDLVKNYEAWEKDSRDANGLFWQVDGRDGMEVSISGALHPEAQGYRATINSYMYGDARAIGNIASLLGQTQLAERFREKAAEIQRLVEERLWDPDAQFYKVIPRGKATFSDARELHGLTPWYFGLPAADKAVAWKQLMDPQGFFAPYGPTTAERRHPKFALSYEGHECQWNGPGWPYSTAVTLTAMANLLNDYQQSAVSTADYVQLLKVYARSHRLTLDDGRTVPWIDENLNPLTGDWIARTRLKSWTNGSWDAGKGGEERGKDYNHSTFCDLVITGLIGLRPRPDNTVVLNPLVPSDWEYFCLDQIPYHGRRLTIVWDRTGERYQRGKGLRILADGRELGATNRLGRLSVTLPSN